MTEVDQHVEEVLDLDPAVAEVLVTEVKVLIGHLFHSNDLDNKEGGEDDLPGLIDGVEEEALDGIDGLHEVHRDTLSLSSSQDGISTRGEDDLGKLIDPNPGTILGEGSVGGGDVSVCTGGLIVVARLEALHYY